MDASLLNLLITPLSESLKDIQNRLMRVEQQVTDLHVLSGRVDVLMQQMTRTYIHIDNDVTGPTTVSGNMHGDIVQGDQKKNGT
jgi:hypothetical protein